MSTSALCVLHRASLAKHRSMRWTKLRADCRSWATLWCRVLIYCWLATHLYWPWPAHHTLSGSAKHTPKFTYCSIYCVTTGVSTPGSQGFCLIWSLLYPQCLKQCKLVLSKYFSLIVKKKNSNHAESYKMKNMLSSLPSVPLLQNDNFMYLFRKKDTWNTFMYTFMYLDI